MKKSLFTLLFAISCLCANAQLGYWVRMGFVELTPDESILYKLVLAMDDESRETLNDLYASLKAVGDKSLIKCNETGLGGWYVKKDYPLPEGNYFESDFYNYKIGDDDENILDGENKLLVVLPIVQNSMNSRGRIEDLLEYLGDRVTVDLIKEDVIEGYEDYKRTDFRFISNLKTSEEWLKLCLDVYNYGFDGLHYFSPMFFTIDKTYYSHLISVMTGSNEEENLVYSMNWEGVEYPVISEFPEYDPWESTAEGLALVNPELQEYSGQVWALINAGGFSLEEGHDYVVRLTMKVPSDGTYTVNLGSWTTNYSHEVSVSASDEFQVVEIPFPNFWGEIEDRAFEPIEEDAHITLCCGWVVGTTVVKKVEVVEIINWKSRGDETAKLGYWAGEKFLFIELTPDNAYNYRYVQTLDEESENALDDLMADAADEAILKFIENRYFVKNDIRLPEGNYFESPIYISSEEGVPIIICPRIVVSLKEGYEIDGLLEQLGSKVTVERSETAYEGGIRYYLACQMNSSEEVLEAVRIISGFIESGGIRYFEPEMYNLSFTMYGEGDSLIDKLKGGDETAINAVKATKADDAIYNLNGQRVNASYKGLVIKNGKKVVIK